jgi:hypothetical protein
MVNVTNFINGDLRLNAGLLCGDNLNCTSHSQTQLNGVNVPLDDRREKYNWYKLVTPTGTKAKNVLCMANGQIAYSGAFFLLDDNRIVFKNNAMNWYSNFKTLSDSESSDIKQIVVMGTRLTSPSPQWYIYAILENGKLYGTPFNNYTNPPTLIASDVREMTRISDGDKDKVFYTKTDKKLYGIWHDYPLVEQDLGISDVEYFTVTTTYAVPRQELSYYSTDNKLRFIFNVRNNTNYPANANANQLTVNGTSGTFNLESLDFATITNGNLYDGNYASNPTINPNVRYSNGVKRLFFRNQTMMAVHTNDYFVAKTSSFTGTFEKEIIEDLPNWKTPYPIFNHLTNCRDIQAPFFDNIDGSFTNPVIYGN